MFRDCDGGLYEFIHAGFGLTVLPAAFTRVVKCALGPPNPDLESWLDDLLILSCTRNEDLAPVTDVLTRLSRAHLSIDYADSEFCAPSQEFLGMIVDDTGIKTSPSKLDAIANMPEPTNFEQPRPFRVLTGYLRNFLSESNIIVATLTNLLGNKTLASEHATK